MSTDLINFASLLNLPNDMLCIIRNMVDNTSRARLRQVHTILYELDVDFKFPVMKEFIKYRQYLRYHAQIIPYLPALLNNKKRDWNVQNVTDKELIIQPQDGYYEIIVWNTDSNNWIVSKWKGHPYDDHNVHCYSLQDTADLIKYYS